MRRHHTPLTNKKMVAARVNPPPAPVTSTLTKAWGVPGAAVKVRTVASPVVETGSNVAVTPAGRPVTVNETAPPKPERLIAMNVCAGSPGFRVRPPGLAEIAKSPPAASLTDSPIVTVRVRPPPVPVTVTVANPSPPWRTRSGSGSCCRPRSTADRSWRSRPPVARRR